MALMSERCDRCGKAIGPEGVWMTAEHQHLKFCSDECMNEYVHTLEYNIEA